MVILGTLFAICFVGFQVPLWASIAEELKTEKQLAQTIKQADKLKKISNSQIASVFLKKSSSRQS